MSIPLLIRAMHRSEIPMVLSNWKNDLADEHRKEKTWGKGLSRLEFWAILDFVMDRVTLPSSTVSVACLESEPMTPLAWMAVRDSTVLHRYARERVREDIELAAYIERQLIGTYPLASRFNPILELRR